MPESGARSVASSCVCVCMSVRERIQCNHYAYMCPYLQTAGTPQALLLQDYGTANDNNIHMNMYNTQTAVWSIWRYE